MTAPRTQASIASEDEDDRKEDSSAVRPRRRHFTMIRDFTLADFITLGNAVSGAGAILAAMNYLVTGRSEDLWLAFGLLPLALVLDYLDGRVARWRRKSSPLGAHLDSLADVISFGIAPVVLGYAVGLRGGWDIVVLLYFLSCGVSRLARFNATCAELADEQGKVKYFEGTPIPTSLAVVAILAVLTARGSIHAALPGGALQLGPWLLHPVVLIFAVSGSAMVSKTLHIPKI